MCIEPGLACVNATPIKHKRLCLIRRVVAKASNALLLITSAKEEVMFSSLCVCLSVRLSVCLSATLRKNFRTDLHEIFREGWQWTNERIMIKFSWRSGSTSEYRDCFPGSSLLGDTESGINRLRCATLQCWACTSRHRHSNYDVIRLPALGGGMHCSSASRYFCHRLAKVTF